MKLAIPTNTHPQVKVTARSGDWSTTVTVDNSFKTVDIVLPEGITEPNVEAYCEFLNAAECVDEVIGKIVIKTRVRQRVPPAKSQLPAAP